MENKNNVLLTIIGAATLLVAIVGASFAYFSATGGTEQKTVSTGKLVISAVSTGITGANIKPVDAAKIATIDQKLAHADVVKLPITINRTGTTIDSEYNMYLTTAGIGLNTAAGEGGSLSDIKWELIKTVNDVNSSVNNGDFATGDALKKQLNVAAIPVPSQTTDDVTTYGGSESYTLLIYIDNKVDTDTESGAQDQLQGLKFTASVTVEAKQK